MVSRRLLFVSLALAFLTSLILAQNQNPSAQTKRESGLTVTTFETRRGSISVKLPDYMSAGDTISGTVVAEPAGKSDKEKQNNAAELNGYVINIENQKTKVSSGVIQRIHLLPDIDEPQLILLDGNGKPAGTVVIPLRPRPATIPSTVTLPALGQAGRPIQIQGPFDGDSSNTKVTVGDKPAQVLAESPRGVVVESPRNVVGPTEIKINENGSTTTGSFRNLKIDLTAPKTSLLKGESTELHVQVQGLEGITQPVQVQLQNHSPSTVNINGGNTQTIPIQPSQVTTGGTFNWSAIVTGTGTGGFNITGSLPAGTTPPPSSSPTTSKPTPTSTPIPTTTPLATTPPPTTPAVTPSPTPVRPPQTTAQVSPTPTDEQRFYSSFAKAETNCCKKLLSGGVLTLDDGHGNSFTIDQDKLKMAVDGKTYEWRFTMDGKPLWIEWMFCHLNDHQIVSQLSQVLAQRVQGGDTNESGNTTSVLMAGPYRDEHSIRPSYGFQFASQKLGSDTKEYSLLLSMDAETCAWSCQLIAEGKVVSFRTDPARSTNAIFNALNQSVGIPSGPTAYQQQEWWNAMYSYLNEITDWYLWLNQTKSDDLRDTNENYNLWRAKLNAALAQMLTTAAPGDKGLITQMQGLLENEHPSPEQIKQVWLKFDDLHTRYGTKVPDNVRRQIMSSP